jgi:hypothetical protein
MDRGAPVSVARMTFEPPTPEALARERALRAAVLIDAIRCLVASPGLRERHSRQAAVRWVSSRDVHSPFSFQNVCESLGFEPGRVRRVLLGRSLGLDLSALGLAEPPQTVRRPRRDRLRYVVLKGGRTA